MARRSSPLLALVWLALPLALRAEALPKPAALTAETVPSARFTWEAVEGAEIYRLAVFDAPDAEGKRPLLAAVWVQGLAWTYGKDPVVAKAGRLASTKPLPLPAGHKLRVMVSAARADGADKSDWAGVDFQVKAPAAAVLIPTATPTLTTTPASGTRTADAELELVGGEEFKSSPDPAVLDIGDSAEGDAAEGTTATASPQGVAATVAAATPTPVPTAGPTPVPGSLDDGRARLKSGKAEEADALFQALVDKDPKNADAWEGLGDSYVARKMKAEAVDAYEQALKLDSSKTKLQDWLDRNVRH